MVSTIRQPSNAELQNARSFRLGAQRLERIEASVVNLAEDIGCRFVYPAEDNRNRLGILMPSKGKILIWDFNPRSLDALQYENSDELRDVSLYAGLTASWLYDTGELI